MVEETKKGFCKRCGKKLKNPDFILIGYGKVCYQKMCQEKSHFKKLFDERLGDVLNGYNKNKKG